MSNNNSYWGKRFGYLKKETEGKTEILLPSFRTNQRGHGKINSGPHQLPLDPRTADGIRAANDRAEFAKNGRPTLYYNSNKVRVT